jgi:long-chain acyl-CoA synthetase
MQSPSPTPILAFGHDTPHKLFRARCQQWAAEPALRHKRKGIWSSASWSQYYEHARCVALAL